METNKNTKSTPKMFWDVVTCIIYVIMHVIWKIWKFIKAHGKQVVVAVLACIGMIMVIPALIYFLIFTGAWFLVLLFIFEVTR